VDEVDPVITRLEATVLRFCRRGGGDPRQIDEGWTAATRRRVISRTVTRLLGKGLLSPVLPLFVTTLLGAEALDAYDDKHDHYP
jgi:hypothetical protein